MTAERFTEKASELIPGHWFDRAAVVNDVAAALAEAVEQERLEIREAVQLAVCRDSGPEAAVLRENPLLKRVLALIDARGNR